MCMRMSELSYVREFMYSQTLHNIHYIIYTKKILNIEKYARNNGEAENEMKTIIK